jgi:DNA-binding response OmpR family regulator
MTATSPRTLLVVDDEPSIRKSIRQLLRRDGYQLLEAPNAIKALQIVQEYEAQIHILLTDVVMPTMDGFALASRVTSQRSETRILFITGHAGDIPSVETELRRTPHAFLFKPFTYAALKRKIEHLVLRRDGRDPSQWRPAVRFIKAIPVLYRPSEHTVWLRGMTVDISDSGVLLEADSPLALGSRLDLTFDASEAFGGMPRGTVCRHGRVVRNGTPTPSTPYPLGIQFTAGPSPL